MRNSQKSIEAIFHSALNMKAHLREDYIRRFTSNQSEFLFILNMLRKAEINSDFLATSYELDLSETLLSINSKVGRWKVIELLGRGGMGEVYKVERTGADFEQSAALKVSRTSQPDLLQRFQDECRILAKLEHPNIGRLIDGGTDDAGLRYFVTELIDGKDIVRYCSDMQLDRRGKIDIFGQLCLAVEHAHQRGILHQDIKPSNVLVSNDGLVKLVDFGISGFIDSATYKSSAPCTKKYAAPEQINGESLGVEADVFSLGRLLKALIYNDDDPDNAPKKAAIDIEIDAIVDKCTFVDASLRYRSVRELIREIERLLSSQPVVALKQKWSYRLSKAFKRNTALIGSFIMVSIGAIFSFSFYKETKNLELENQYWFTRASLTSIKPSEITALGCGQDSIQVFNNELIVRGALTERQQGIAKLAGQYSQDGVPISALSFTPDCEGIALVTDANKHTSNVKGELPIHYYSTINRLMMENKQITAVAFDPDRWDARAAFVIAYNGGFEASPDTSKELIQRLKAATESDGYVAGLDFYPKPGYPSGWTVLGAKGYQYTRNVTKKETESWYYENLRFLRTKNIIPTYVSFSRDGNDYVLGNEKCVYSSRKELLHLTGCPLFIPQID
ncbi:serine/threonine-protein kinase [Arenicella sp. 4NH20-0111]|uniref:serine/threonine protein kinase n=1 Tax=Arenicella sp. 4NH20-0111 TaxID=3127648 RepID=UPI003341D881